MSNDMRKLMESVKHLDEAPKKAKPGSGQRAPSGGEEPWISIEKKIVVIDDWGSKEVWEMEDREDAIISYAESYAEYHLPAGSAKRDTVKQWDALYEKGLKLAKRKLGKGRGNYE